MTDVHVVSSSLMEELIASVAKHVENGNSRATAVVLITVVTHSRTRELHLSRNDAIKALERLTESSKGSPALETDIVHFKTRISP
jgi:hypothetical protein